VNLFRRIRAWLKGEPVNPAALKAAREEKYDLETTKT
jgi:hypothetical protein